METRETLSQTTILTLAVWTLVFCVLNVNAGTNCTQGKLDVNSQKKCKGGYEWNCTNLSLNEVPTTYPQYNASRKLCFLDLSWNNLTTIPNNSFVGLTDVLWLWLYQNNLTLIDSDAFSGLHNLFCLDLSSNSLEYPGGFAKDMLKPLVTLEHINLKNNSINSYHDLEDLIQPLRNLKGLLISGCYNCTFGEGFENLTNLTSLSLSGSDSDKNPCNISTLFNETFIHLPSLVELEMIFCNITEVESGAMSPLRNIQTLDISHNTDLHFKGMKNVLIGLAYSPIDTLGVSAIHEQFERGTILTKEYVEPIKDLNQLNVLYMERNKLEVIEEEVFDLIPNSTSHFLLAGNRLTYGKYVEKVSNMTHIVYLDLSRQHLNYDPFLQKYQKHLHGITKMRLVRANNEYEDRYNFEFSKNDESKLIHSAPFELFGITGTRSTTAGSHGSIFSPLLGGILPTEGCKHAPESLTYLLWRASFVYVHIYALKICQPNSLKSINLSFNLLERWVGPVNGLEKLEELNLAENICEYMSHYFFDNFHSLIKLNVSYNYLGPSLEPTKLHAGKHFKNLRKLQNLDLSGTGINALPNALFENMAELQYLNVSRNMLSQWNCTLKTTCLRIFDLSNNKIEFFSQPFRNYLDSLINLRPEQTCNRSGVPIVILSGNPIQCNCDNRPFLRWLSESPVEIHFYEDDECHLQDGRRLQLSNQQIIPQFVNHLDIICVPYVFIGISVGVFLVSIGLCIMVYRYRWKLRHLYFSKRKRYQHKGYNRLFERDAFISYAKTEAGFIKEKLVPSLEGDNHCLNVWVADRDALAGTSIAENLTHAIYSSKKTVLLLSRRYFMDSWCNYEMNMARIESIESQRKLLIIVLYEDISAKDMPLDYLRLLKTVESIEYPIHPQHQDTFWASLARAIQDE